MSVFGLSATSSPIFANAAVGSSALLVAAFARGVASLDGDGFADAVAVALVLALPPPLVVDAPGWSALHGLLDEVWFVETDEATRLERLVQRHAANGKPRDLAQRWATVSDQANAELVAATRERADLVVRLD